VKENSCRGGKELPWVNLNGNWLEAVGFGIGDQIEIDIQEW
jgi:hypothetical protein